MARINTAKTLHNNSYFEGNNYDLTFNNNAPISVHPSMYSQYDFAMTDDPELLNDRMDSAKIIYDIFKNSEYNDGRFNIQQERTEYSNEDSENFLIRIPKENVKEVFEYVKTELLKRKKLNSIELIIAINEFFDFNYEFVYKKVLSSKDKQEILDDYYTNEGMKRKMDECTSIKLF